MVVKGLNIVRDHLALDLPHSSSPLSVHWLSLLTMSPPRSPKDTSIQCREQRGSFSDYVMERQESVCVRGWGGWGCVCESCCSGPPLLLRFPTPRL